MAGVAETPSTEVVGKPRNRSASTANGPILRRSPGNYVLGARSTRLRSPSDTSKTRPGARRMWLQRDDRGEEIVLAEMEMIDV